MIGKVRRPQASAPATRAEPAPRTTTTLVQRVSQSASRFEASQARAKATGIRDGSVRRARRELAQNLWALRGHLRSGDAPAALAQARSLAARVGVALSSKATTAERVLTLVGRQLVDPQFTFHALPDLPPIRRASYARLQTGRINDPDPSLRPRRR
jgi:hypothetical protein